MSDITDKIGKLLALADATSNEHERDAFVSKAQALATTYAVDLELARTRQRNKTIRETPEVRHINIGERGAKGNALACSLFILIGEVNDVTFNIAHNSTYVIAFGYPSDIDITERLYASLSVQRTRACDEAISRGDHKLPENLYYSEPRDPWSWEPGKYRADARVFRTSFYEGFNSALRVRLREAKAEAEARVVEAQEATEEFEASEATTGALVLADKRKAVRDFYNAKSTARGSWKGSGGGTRVSGAFSSGRAAGNNANIHGTQGSLGGARTAIG